MFGREAERTQIEVLLDSVAAGPVGLALEGAPGVGKTTLWRAAVASARRRGYRVLEAAPGEPDAALAFAGLGDLLDGVIGEVVADLPDPQRHALLSALSLGDASAAPAEPTALPRAVLRVIRGVAASGPVAVAIDDEQWLDRPSARVLAFALSRLRTEPVCVLLTRRLESDGALWPELAGGFGVTGLETLTVAPLDLNTIDVLLRSQLGRTIPRPVLRRIHAVSGGNPLYALATARELDQSQAGLANLAIPRTLSEAMLHRLRAVDERASDPMLVVAAASHTTLALLQAVIPGFALSDLDSALRAEVIEVVGDRVRFTHPLLASTHYASAPPAKGRELHRVLANVLEDQEDRARHLALGTEAPDREIALALEQAAEVASARGAPDSAALLLEDAARLTPMDATEVRWSRTIAAAEQHNVSGNAARARELLEGVLPDISQAPTRARALFQLARVRTDDQAVVQALLEQALDAAGDHHRLRAEIEMMLSDTLSGRAEFAASLVHSRAALQSAKRAGDPGLLAAATGDYAAELWISGGAVDLEAVRSGIELEESVRIPTTYRPSVSLAQILFWSDDYEPARPALEQVIRLVEARGEVYETSFFVFHLALLEWYDGRDLEAAERHRIASAELDREQGHHPHDLLHVWLEGLSTAGRGEFEAARARAVPALELGERIGHPLFATLPTTLLALLELWTGQPAAAHDRLRPFREAFLASGFGFMGSLTLDLWSIDIEALIACGRLDEAQLVFEDLLRPARGSKNPNAIAIAERCRGLLLRARGEIEPAMAAMETALTEHARRPLRRQIARTLLELGTLQRRAKQKSAAKETLERALAMFEPMGAQMWVDRTRDELSRIGLRRPTVSEGLTPAQTRVAELVVDGLSNREIAGTLYMSPRSVEAHLTKIYREYGVRSRAQLVAAMSSTQAATGKDD